jgi:hypothetical protein
MKSVSETETEEPMKNLNREALIDSAKKEVMGRQQSGLPLTCLGRCETGSL